MLIIGITGSIAMGKTTAALVLLKEYLRVVDLVWIISGTIEIDPAYKQAKAMVKDTLAAALGVHVRRTPD